MSCPLIGYGQTDRQPDGYELAERISLVFNARLPHAFGRLHDLVSREER